MQSLDDLEAEMKRTLTPLDESWRWRRSSHLPDIRAWREYRRAGRGMGRLIVSSVPGAVMDSVTDGSVHFEPLATVPLKGVAHPVALFIASRSVP